MEQIFIFILSQGLFYFYGVWTVFQNILVNLLIIIFQGSLLYFFKVKNIKRYFILICLTQGWIQIISLFLSQEISRNTENITLTSQTISMNYLFLIFQVIILILIILLTAHNYKEKKNELREIVVLTSSYIVNISLIVTLILFNIIQFPK